MTAPIVTANNNAACPGCGAVFRCGMQGGDAHCWCYDLPHGLSVPTESAASATVAGCFCPACLVKKLAELPPGQAPVDG